MDHEWQGSRKESRFKHNFLNKSTFLFFLVFIVCYDGFLGRIRTASVEDEV